MAISLGTVIFRHALEGLLNTGVWIDCQPVRILFSDPFVGKQIGICIRNRKLSKGGSSVHSRPDVIRHYNKQMGGVDRRYFKFSIVCL